MIRKLLCFLRLHAGTVESEASDVSVKGYRIYFQCAYCKYKSYAEDIR
jgi:hypothetical protein